MVVGFRVRQQVNETTAKNDKLPQKVDFNFGDMNFE